MEKTKSWKMISANGNIIKRKWQQLAYKHQLKIKISGLPALPKFKFDYKENDLYIKTLTQEMLRTNFLVTNFIYLCVDHNKQILKKYFVLLDKHFKTISNMRKS